MTVYMSLGKPLKRREYPANKKKKEYIYMINGCLKQDKNIVWGNK